MTAEQELWDDLRELLETDDGSLPEVVLVDPPPAAIQPIFALLRERAVEFEGGLHYPPCAAARRAR